MARAYLSAGFSARAGPLLPVRAARTLAKAGLDGLPVRIVGARPVWRLRRGSVCASLPQAVAHDSRRHDDPLRKKKTRVADEGAAPLSSPPTPPRPGWTWFSPRTHRPAIPHSPPLPSPPPFLQPPQILVAAAVAALVAPSDALVGAAPKNHTKVYAGKFGGKLAILEKASNISDEIKGEAWVR
jgi:hypothetical protein